MAKAIELRPPRRRALAAGEAIGAAPPEGGPSPGGRAGDGPVLGVVRVPERETAAVAETGIELGVDFTATYSR